MTEVVTAPLLLMPVTAWLLAEVAQPRRVLLLMDTVAPVELFDMPIKFATPLPVVGVRAPALERLPAKTVYPVRMLSGSPLPMVLLLIR